MEDSHNHPVKRAQTSLNPQAPSTSYQVNVSRKKTRKWVEAKVQSYDGDDWGADEYDDDESDHEPPPPPPINPSLRTFSGTDLLHSRHNTPSPASSLSALPSLRPPIPQQQQQQQQFPAVPPASQPPRIGVTSPVVSDVSFRSASESIASDSVVSPQSVTTFQGREGDSNLSLAGISQLPSQAQQHQQQQGPVGYDVSRSSSFDRAIKPASTPPVVGDRFTSPQTSAPPAPPADQPPPIIYSPDNYSRFQDDRGYDTLALAPTIVAPAAGSDQFTSTLQPLTRTDTRDTWERDDDSSHADNLDGQAIRPDVETQAGAAAALSIDRGRMSVSPKLPDLARMSAFGADLFSSSSSTGFSKEPTIIETPGNKGEPATSPAAVPAAADSNQGFSPAGQSPWQPPPVVPAEEEDHPEAPGGAPLSQPNSLFPGRNIPSIPPLRTPSPSEQRSAVPFFDSTGTKITPTEPLQPGRGEPLPDFENPQLFQRVQTYSTATSSPIKDSPLKENDVLSDEILRTLSPSGATAAETKLSDGPQLHPPDDRSAVRESSYTLMDYDSYWADTAENSGLGQEDASAPPPPENLQSTPAAAEVLPAQSTQPDLKLSTDTTSTPPPPAAVITFDTIFSPQQSHPVTQQQPREQQQQEQQQQPRSSLRRRFSWEAEEEQRTPTAQAPPADDASSAPAVHLTAPSGQPFEPSVTNLSNESRSHSPVSQLSQAPSAAPGSGLGTLALQTSIPGHDSSLPEPPSPVSVSVTSDKPSTTAREQTRLSIADEKILADQGSVSLVTGTAPPPSESHPAVSSPTSAASVPAPQAPAHNPLLQAKAMNFRDIMALSAPSERIAKYNEARQILASRDSGLESWLLYLTTEHPELSASISAPGQMTSQSTNSSALPVGSQPSSQQPYYQQYLNASSPSTSVPQSGGGGSGGGSGGRSRLGGLSMPSQMSGSAFGHSGNQIGTKSKEFMHSAGKMGKGLLSKGKSKLRGSGDKVDIIPPEHPTPNKPQRRSTWRFSLEPRPREDDPAPHSNDDISTTPPQLPDPSPVSPLNAASGPGSAFPWTVSNDTPDPDPSAVKQLDDEGADSDELITSAFLYGAYPSEKEEHAFPAGQRVSDANPDVVTQDDWVMVQHQGEQSQAQRMSMSHRAMANGTSAPGTGAEAGDQAWQPQTQTQTQNQPQGTSDTPKRNSSFIGLPPIRRGSTFGTKSKARRATERFALDDDDDDEHDGGLAVDGADSNVPLSTVSGAGASLAPAETVTGAPQGSHNEKPLPPQPTTQGLPAAAGAEFRFAQGQTPNAGHQQPPPQQLQYPGGPNPQFAQGAPPNVPPGMPAPILGSLVQKFPPAGAWKLEESHLTEPLHLTKKRSGTDFAQQSTYSAYDKELGLEFPAAPMAPVQGPPGRFRSDVPPSSARRYPELFSLSPAQDPRQYGRGQGYPPPQMVAGRPPPPREGAVTLRQQQQGGPEGPAGGMTAEERGRRRNSGIFKDIGTRLSRAASKERRSSVPDGRPPSTQLRGDEVSETSVATAEDISDRRRKRASFLGFSGRPSSTDQVLRRDDDMKIQPQQRDSRSAGAGAGAGADVPTESREERKRSSLFGGAQLKIGPGNFSRSSTSTSALEQTASPGGDGRESGAPHKRRISDIAKVSGIAGLFARSRQDRSSMGAMPRQNPQALNQEHAIPERPPMQLPSLDFTSDPLDSMSSLGFEESFQNYRQEEQQPQPQQRVHEQMTQRQLGDSQPFSVGPINLQSQQMSPLPAAVGSQERVVASTGLSSHPVTQFPQGMSREQGHQPPLMAPAPNVTAAPAPAIEKQMPPGNETLETPRQPHSDSMVDEKTPRLQDFMFQEKMAALHMGGLEDTVSEEEVSRSQTVSPDISIASNLKTEEQGLNQSHSHASEHNEAPEEILITPPPETSLPATTDTGYINHSMIGNAAPNNVPPSIHSFPSVSSLREKPDIQSIQQEEGTEHQAEGGAPISPKPSPQVAKSQVSSEAEASVSQHQQLQSPALVATKPSEIQNTNLPVAPLSQTRPVSDQRPDSHQRPVVSEQQPVSQQWPAPQQQRSPNMAEPRQFPAPGSPLPAGNQPVQQQLRPQYPPSVSVSNISEATEPSTPVYTVRQSGPQNLFPGLPGPFGRPSAQPADAAPQQKESQGSRWKGLKNRMSEQISQRTQPQPQPQPQLQQQQQQQLQQQNQNQGQGQVQSQNKTAVGEKIKGNKLLGALRRTSKQPEPAQSQSSPQPSLSSKQPPNPNLQPHPQGYQQQQQQQQQPGQLQGPRPNAVPANQYLQPSMQPPNLPRAKTMPPGPAQQNVPPRDLTRSSEPRYENVPIPRGYAAVHGEGVIVPSPYHQNLRRQMPNGQFAPVPRPQPHPHPQHMQQRQWQGGHPPPMPHQPQPGQYQGNMPPPRMAQGPASAPLPNERPAHMRVPSDPRSDYFNSSRSPDSLNTQMSQHNRNNSQSSYNSRAEPPRRASDMSSILGVSHPGSPQPSERENLSVMDGPRSASRSPAVSVGADDKPDLHPDPKPDGKAEPARPLNLGIDVEKAQQLVEDDLYAATPKKVPNGTSEKGEQSAASRNVSDERAEGSVAAGPSTRPANASTVVAELEDTEEARKRAIRLASQEEKIFYEPEDFEPKMSATSYPGQEWNPFGEAEFADWRED